MKQITILITALNEGHEPVNTIESIYETCDPKIFDIILVNDGTQKEDWKRVPRKYKEVTVVENEGRRGAPYSFDLAAGMAVTPYLFICNARMRFTQKGWMERGIEYLQREQRTLFCTTSIVFHEGDEKPGRRRYGARILGESKDHSILEPEWLKPRDGDAYEVPCILGANYFITNAWYRYIEGFRWLNYYGGMCAYLSLKSWAFGGSVKLIKEIEIGNVYRELKPYHDHIEDIVWNKVLTAFLLLPWNRAYGLMHKIKFHELFGAQFELVKNRLIRTMPEIQEQIKHIKKKQIQNVEHLIS